MSRLLFAAARGARIQFLAAYGDLAWCETTRLPLMERSRQFYRIHPEDEHMQYGPISSALRKSVEDGTLYSEAHIPYITGEYDFGAEIYAMLYSKQWQRDLFKLILAEALADEGL